MNPKISQQLIFLIAAIEQIEVYTQTTVTIDEFKSNPMCQDAILMQFIVIGEIANNLPEGFKDQFAEIPWHKMIGMRNLIAHGYARVQLEIVWDAIQLDVPPLKKQIQNIVMG